MQWCPPTRVGRAPWESATCVLHVVLVHTGSPFLLYLVVKPHLNHRPKWVHLGGSLRIKFLLKTDSSFLYFLSFLLGWQIPNLITGLSGCCASDQSHNAQEIVPNRCNPRSRPTHRWPWDRCRIALLTLSAPICRSSNRFLCCSTVCTYVFTTHHDAHKICLRYNYDTRTI